MENSRLFFFIFFNSSLIGVTPNVDALPGPSQPGYSSQSEYGCATWLIGIAMFILSILKK